MKVPQPKKSKNGTWYIQFRFDGGSQYIYGSTETECRNKAILFKGERLNNIHDIKPKQELTLRQACEQYIAKKETAKRSPETVRGYDIILRHRFQSIMDKPVDKIKNWQRIYDEELQKYSAKTMKNTWSFIRSAVKSECKVDLPEVETVAYHREEHPFLTPEQIRAFVREAGSDKYRTALLLALCSCRASEILALDWRNVDLDNNTVYIKGAVVRDKNNQKVEKKENKTDKSSRYVPLFIPELQKALRDEPNKTGKVVTANENTLLEHANSVCDAAGIPRVGVHGLRHSFASLCYSLNVPVKVTMQIGGWSDYSTVMRIYTHLAQKDVSKHAQEITQFFQIT